MSVYSPSESDWTTAKKHPIVANGEYSSPTKRSRPSLSQRLGLADESDQSDNEPYSPSDDNALESQQRIIRQPQASLRESTLMSTGQPSKAILELLNDDDEDEEEEEEVNVVVHSTPRVYVEHPPRTKRTVRRNSIQPRWTKSVIN